MKTVVPVDWKMPLSVQTLTPVPVKVMVWPLSLSVVPAPIFTMPADTLPLSVRTVPLVVVSRVAPEAMVIEPEYAWAAPPLKSSFPDDKVMTPPVLLKLLSRMIVPVLAWRVPLLFKAPANVMLPVTPEPPMVPLLETAPLKVAPVAAGEGGEHGAAVGDRAGERDAAIGGGGDRVADGAGVGDGAAGAGAP